MLEAAVLIFVASVCRACASNGQNVLKIEVIFVCMHIDIVDILLSSAHDV